MSANSRLTLSAHTLTLMAYHREAYEFLTSEQIARSVQTNPVILRGLLGRMEKQHLVHVQRGCNAGWQLARNPEEISLLDVYNAVEQPTLFALHHTQPNLRCAVGCGIGSALEDVYASAQSTLEQELACTTIADLLRATLARSAALRSQDNVVQIAPSLESS